MLHRVDLTAGDGQPELAQARSLVARSTRIFVLTGAGISTDSGIPDFRGPQGVWTRNPRAERLATLDHYLGDPEVRRMAWQNRAASPVWTAEPNAGHRALVELERSGRLSMLATQNIDGLHRKAGSSPETLVELHGTMHETVCWSCRDRRPMTEALERVRAGDDDPSCVLCGGILKSATVLFGEPLDEDLLQRAAMAAAACDLVIAVGSTLNVVPVAALVPTAHRAGASVVIVNGDPTAFDHLADALVRGSISEVLPQIVAT